MGFGRPSFWALILSVGGHVGAIWLLLVVPIPSGRTETPNRDFILREARKIVWYKSGELPRITPPEIRRAPVNRGTVAKQLQSALTQPKAKPVERFVFAPAEPPKIVANVPAPDLLRLEAGRPNLPPPPPPPQRAAPKQFVPRAAAKQTPRVSETAPALALPPELAAQGAPVTSAASTSALNRIVPPLPTVDTSVLQGAAGDAVTSALVINRIPAPDQPPVVGPPNPGQVSRAEEAGTPAVREQTAAGLSVPGAAVDSSNVTTERRTSGSSAPEPGRQIVYQVSRLGAAQSAMSVPLRPSVRSVPGYVEQVFRGRNVYTMIVPMKRTAGYSTDWVLWFGEIGGNNVDGRVRAPLPLLKREAAAKLVADRPADVKVLLRLDKSGQVQEATVLTSSVPSANAYIQADIREWSFRAGSRDGVPFEADVILEYTLMVPSKQGP